MSTANIIGNAIFGLRNKSGGNYIDPAVKESLVGLWKFDQNTNESPTRNIIKNTIKDKGGDLELLNFGYKLNSGYGKYEVDFTDWSQNNSVVNNRTSSMFNASNNTPSSTSALYQRLAAATNPFKIQVKGIKGDVSFRYYINENDVLKEARFLLKEGINELPASLDPTSVSGRVGFIFHSNSTATIIQIPLYEGALVTDGKDDMIVSQKTVQEMLGGSNVCTVVSMIHQINLSTVSSITSINNIRSESVAHVCARHLNTAYGKTGIFGYSKQLNTTINPTLINNILGDKKDYIAEGASVIDTTDKYFVQGYKYNDSLYELSEVAVYWTFIANKVLTTDEINQIIAYFKLDKYVTPQVIYDVKRQGLTNDTPNEDWYLKDFSGNGHDMQLYNYAKTPESGINEDGGLQSDGIDDYGKAEGLPIFKDYTVAVDRAIIGTNKTNKQVDGGVSAKCLKYNNGSYVIDYLDGSFSYGGYLAVVSTIDRIISYQSKYITNGKAISAGSSVDASDLYIAKLGIEERYSTIAVWSYLLFPYSLSEFLLERQLKKYKLGTLYPDMVEWRPKVNINVPVVTPPTFSINNGSDIITNGQYIPEGTEIVIRIFTTTDSSVEGINEATAKINGVDIELTPSGNKTYYGGKFIISSKQKIDITIDEYIRFEDIIQPYPAIVNIPKVDGGYYTYGDKIPVGYRFRRESAINLLPELYSLSDIFLNGELCNVSAEIVISKSMVFTANKTWLLDTTEPHAIYSPQKLNIPNSSLKILGYVPDLTGKGNHGKLNNFAYTEDSGVAADGSIKFDGTDDHITIPTLAHGGKCVMMKVNLQSYDRYLYDQRNSWSQYLAIVSAGNTIAYSYSNQGGKTYIDGILNENIIDKDLIGITHNITVTNSGNAKSYSPNIGTSFAKGNFTNMSLYEFMLFPEIPSEDEIKKLNDVMGIEGGYVESPNYY